MNKARRRSIAIPIEGGATEFMDKSTQVSTPQSQTLWVYNLVEIRLPSHTCKASNNMKKDMIFTEISNIMHSFKTLLGKTLNQNGWPHTATHFKVLSFIRKNQPCTGQSLALILKRDKAQVTRLLQDLLESGFISKTINPADKRCQNLELTDTGKNILESLDHCKQDVLNLIFKKMPLDDQTTLLTLLQQMQQNIDTAEIL